MTATAVYAPLRRGFVLKKRLFGRDFVLRRLLRILTADGARVKMT